MSAAVVPPTDAVFFYGHSVGKPYAEFSNFYPSVFTVGTQTYSCAEQYIMAEKARAFGDHKQLEVIMRETKPAKMKAAGRKVKGYDEKRWVLEREQVALTALKAKFEQNSEKAKLLLSTGDAMIYEASPRDRQWGIGMSEEKARNT